MSGESGRGWAWALIVAGVVVALDQAAKAAALDGLATGERINLVLGIDLTEVSNKGVAFGFLGGGGPVVVVVTAIALVLVLGWFVRNPQRPLMWLAVGLLTGGALGNLADRARIGAVTDFIDPPLWPAFNLADVAITAGAILLALLALAPEPRR